MTAAPPDWTAEVLALVDADRRAAGRADGPVVREVDAAGDCRITYAAVPAAGLPALIAAEARRADAGGYALEWKAYGHDPVEPGPALLAAGFAAGEPERLLALPLTPAAPAAFPTAGHDPHRLTLPPDPAPPAPAAGLAEVVAVAVAVGRADARAEAERLAALLRADPAALSVWVDRVGGAPAASARAHYPPGSALVELAGGRTVPAYRRRGCFTALVGARLAEALARGRRYAVVDALPTSAPTLLRRGFREVGGTRPYTYTPAR
ncbi:hypothetical protein GCM10010123_26130 [Pilimelia anulata]|uniref:N-acetyltransferase domain-containing protein n=1 Tax=Pilimelia anulata TaxID=53371 RepID=A0A8J3B7J2_9ACTN|nr:hypothetical protein [Pilimelia anulata]GGJ95109.1 hypothetical protein GCM10010123_26130 [Pilimelia anulata]